MGFGTTADIADIAATGSAGAATTVPRANHVHALAGLGAWTSYTPSWTSNATQPAIGNGSLSGYFQVIGKILFFKIALTPGTTTTFGTGQWSFSLPSGKTSANNLEGSVGTGRALPGGTYYAIISSIGQNSTTVSALGPTSSTNNALAFLDATHPAAWSAAASNQMFLAGMCEIA